ncbi:MAG: cupin domain-containing protein [Gaiellaceae bacterium MAG52_C11]|nr:cupin domain-containing protein [Candidatus Gaiellasilicea maunaloa]
MIHPGERLENPITGEALVFHRTSAQTDGEEVFVEVIVHPHGFVAAAHVHPYQTERFEVLEGRLGLRRGDEQLVATPGDIAVVNPGTAHRFWNAGDQDVRFTVEVRPALQFESLIETMFTLAARGKTNRKGLPNPLRLAVIAQAHFDTVRLPFPPPALQRAALALGAPLGKALGYHETVTRTPAAATDRPHSRPIDRPERARRSSACEASQPATGPAGLPMRGKRAQRSIGSQESGANARS